MSDASEEFTWPETVRINAYPGHGTGGVVGTISNQATGWVLRNAPLMVRTFLRPPVAADPRDWRDPRVGWGVILPEKAGLSPAALATAQDAPAPIQTLVE